MTALERSNRSWAWTCRSLAAAGLSLALAFAAIQPGGAVEPAPVKIAVFDFELDDRSAGGGIIGADATDTEHLKNATEVARRRLAASGRYSLDRHSVVSGKRVSVRVDLGGCRIFHKHTSCTFCALFHPTLIFLFSFYLFF